MKIEQGLWSGAVALALLAVSPGIAASIPNAQNGPTRLVVTVRSAHDNGQPQNLTSSDLKIQVDKTPAPVVQLTRFSGDLANMQLFVLLDDSSRSSSLGIQLPELKTFVQSLPATTEVAIGYMQNGRASLAQAFTADHQKAAGALRLPMGVPGENGSPYFALTDLMQHWPSKEATGRRAVLTLTDGVDRYYGNSIEDDPYVDQTIHDALKDGVMVYSIYLRGSGIYGRGGWSTNFAQSRLMEVSQKTGGHAYFEDFTDPVTIAPFLKDFRDRLGNQYGVTLAALNKKGIQPMKLRTELPGVKIEGPTRVDVQ